MGKFIGFLILLALDVPAVSFRGFVLASLWLWFVVPLGVTPIGKAQAIGISILVSVLTKQQFVTEVDDGKPGLEKGFVRLFVSVFATLGAWGFGALAASYM